MIECPFNGPAPTSVSLVEFSCDHAENNLKILDIQPTNGRKKRFGVCSKMARLDNRFFVIRFVEWIHMMQLLGAEKIHFSYEYVHPDLFKIINYFEQQGIIETWGYLNPSGIKDSELFSRQSRQLQVNVQTDCFYRVRNMYDFVAIVDLDEIIIPVTEVDLTWDDILKRAIKPHDVDAFVFRNVYYPDLGLKSKLEVPHFLYILQHTARSQNSSPPGDAVKSLFKTETVLTVHNHMPHHCIGSQTHNCKYYDVPINIGQNSHYRNHLDDKVFNITQENRTIWKYKEKLIKLVEKTLTETEFIP